ncbi:hypothetical protein AB0W93_20285, partial [Escherichia coli]
SPMTSLKTSIKTITYLSDTGCLEIQGASLVMDAGLPYSILRDQIFTHPSMSESLNDLFSLVK